jgi:hypothetical protein
MPDNTPSKFMNPYLGGVGLGLTLLASFLILGAGLGASGGLARVAACSELFLARTHTLASEYFGQWGQTPMRYYLVFMLGGIFLGGLFSALLANRVQLQLERGRSFRAIGRITFALIGGILVGEWVYQRTGPDRGCIIDDRQLCFHDLYFCRGVSDRLVFQEAMA